MLINTGAIDFTGVAITSVEQLEYSGAGISTATFLGTQMGGGASFTTVTGSAGANNLSIDAAASDVNLSGLTFNAWTAGSDTIAINGSASDETLTGSSKNDIINGAGGPDIIDGGDGDDLFDYVAPADFELGESVAGGAGTDSLRLTGGGVFTFSGGVSGVEQIIYAQGAGLTATATFTSPIAPYLLIGGAGVDVIQVVGLTNSSIAGLTFNSWTDGVDLIIFNGGAGNQTLTGSSRNDTINGNGGIDTINAGDGDDILDGGAGDDTLIGGIGNDRLFVNSALDIVNEAVGGGNDEVRTSANYTLKAGQEIETLSTADVAGITSLALTGNEFGQTLNGNAGTNTLDGKDGADIMNGLGGGDIYFVDNGGDVVNEAVGAGGVDLIQATVSYALKAGQEIEQLTTNDASGVNALDLTGNEFGQEIFGNDGANVFKGLGGADVMTGFGGLDTADYSEKAAAVVVFLDGNNEAVVTVGGAAEDKLRAIENLNGGSGGDSLVGDGLSNVLNGNGGADFLFSHGFNPDGTMKTNAGNDALNGGDGNDGLFAGDGADTLDGGSGNDGMVGGGGGDTLNGGIGGDFLFGGFFTTAGAFAANSGADTLNGGDGNDGLYGFDGADTINADAGDDYVEGGAGNDVINGGAGSDFLLGQGDNDTINGGTGFDFMFGDVGADTFIFRKNDSADWILDFSAAQGDKLRFENFGFANFAAIPLVDLSTPGNPAVQLTFIENGNVDQLTIFGATLAQLNAGNVLVA